MNAIIKRSYIETEKGTQTIYSAHVVGNTDSEIPLATRMEIDKRLPNLLFSNQEQSSSAIELDVPTGGAREDFIIKYINENIGENNNTATAKIYRPFFSVGQFAKVTVNRFENVKRISRFRGFMGIFISIKSDARSFIDSICQSHNLSAPESARSAIDKELTERLLAASLPDKAPELYKDRPVSENTGRRETIVEFLDRVWGDPWIAAGVFTRGYFRRIDRAGEQALQNFLRDSDNKLPFEVPTISDVNDKAVDDPEQVRRAWATIAAVQRRGGKAGMEK